MIKRASQAAEFGRVAVVMGGTAAEREISLKSGTAVLAALRRKGVDAAGLDIHGNLFESLQSREFDRVFNIIHGRGGEDGVLQGAMETLGIPYTGSGVLASALAMDKLRTKLCWKGAEVPTPRWIVLETEADLSRCVELLGFPLIVKPAAEGSSIGMSRAERRVELEDAWRQAAQYACAVFAEAWVDGAEYTVAILDDEPLPLIRLETPNTFYDFDAKYRASTTRYHCPSGLVESEEQAIQRLALHACRVLGVRGWARVDLLVDRSGNPALIEVNTVPGMTDHSLVPMAAKAAGIDFDDLVWRILETSLGQR